MEWLTESDEVICRRMLENIDNDITKISGSFSSDILATVAIELAENQIMQKEIKNQIGVENKFGKDLDIYVYDLTGKKRRRATKATGGVTFEGKEGSLVPAETLVTTGYLNFKTLEDAVLDKEGSANVLVECLEEGKVGNVLAYEIKDLNVGLVNISKVYNPKAFLNGYEEESDSSFKKRYYEYIKAPPTSGNKSHYKIWAKEIEGVGEAKVIPIWNGPGTVKVLVIDYEMEIANSDLLEKVYQHIEGQRPIGAEVSVASASPKDINISAKISIAKEYEIKEIISRFKEKLDSYRKEIAFKKSYISYAKIGQNLLETEGVLDYEDLLVNSSKKSIELKEDEIPIFKDILLEL